MNSQIKTIVDPTLYNTFLEISKDDIILQNIPIKNDNLKEFVNALLAGIICIADREKTNQELIKQILESNPQVKEILTLKNDNSLLLEKENP